MKKVRKLSQNRPFAVLLSIIVYNELFKEQ